MRARVLLTLGLSASWIGASGCSRAPEAPKTQARAHTAPVVSQGRPTEAELAAAALEVVDFQLRTGRTRVGEAVRLHVTAWRSSAGPSFDPVVEVLESGMVTITRVGDEIVEEQDGRVRERIDFLIEPTTVGIVSLIVSASASLEPAAPRPAPRPETTVLEAGVQRHELTLIIGEALPEAELAALLADQPGRIARGRALTQQGDYARAIDVYNLALEHQRDDPVVLTELGWAAFLATDYSLARRATREGLRHQPDPHSRGALLYNLGRIAEALDRDDEAIAAYRRSLEVRPEAPTVRKRLATLEAEQPSPTCTDASDSSSPGSRRICPLTPPVDAIRACELIEEEACPLFREPGSCSCDADGLAELDAIGPWRLLTLSERDAEPASKRDAGIAQVHVLFVDAPSKPDAPRYHVFGPLPGSHFHGEFRGGVRSADLVGERLRIDFEGTVPASSLLPEDAGEPKVERLIRRWTLLCTLPAKSGPVCQAPILTGYQTAGEPEYRAKLEVSATGDVKLDLEDGKPPAQAELDLEFPNAVFQVAI